MIKNMLKKNLWIKFWLPPILWASVIFTFSSLPTVETTTFYLWDFLIKKTAHFVEYAILATLVYRALINSKVDSKKAMWISVLASFLYAASDEYHQSFVPGRGPALRDVIIDTVGALFAIYGVIPNLNKFPKFIQDLYKKYSIVINY